MKRLADYLRGLGRVERIVALVCAGALATFALAPFGFLPVMFIAMPLVVLVIDGALADRAGIARVRAGFAAGWWFGLGYFVFGLWWLGVAIWKDGAYWALPFAVLGFPAVLALFYGLAGAISAPFWRGGPLRLLAFAIAMVLAEWLRGHIATGFPWNAIGYTAMPVPILMQADRLTGIYVMGGLAVFVFGAPAFLADRSGRIAGLTAAMVIVVSSLGYGWHRLSQPEPAAGSVLNFRLVQPDFDDQDWATEEGRGKVFATLMALSSEPPAPGTPPPDVIVWPESSLPFLLEERPDARTAISGMLQPGQVLILGAARFAGRKPDGWPQFHNAVYVLNDEGETVSIAGKTHLVPFGEYLPFEDFFRSIGLSALTRLPGSYVPAANRQMLVLPDGTSLFPLVCYEAVFPRLVADGTGDAVALLNVTYDAWFGYTPGPFQHLMQARLRAIETGKPLIRVGENGVTAVVDAHGRVRDRLPFDTRGFLDVHILHPKAAK
ncbi:apolipoprotein N-acyltransferase, partial [Martelella endophytica]|uniref:apolipoprotein N-acyltransferase n=1 Tax=Martelella endophytica TaxID=1486262 RepID=UPI0005F2347C